MTGVTDDVKHGLSETGLDIVYHED
jgi:hypothetical protein